MDPTLEESWGAFATLCVGFYAATAEAALEADWFGALSRTSSAELNVGGLNSRAGGEAAVELVQLFGPGQPGIVFCSEHASDAPHRILADAGFQAGETPEPLMRCRYRPEAVESEFEVSRCQTDDEFEIGLQLTSEAHTVNVQLLAASIGQSARSGAAQVWLARRGHEAVSALWICRSGSSIGVMEMMTPPRHQGRGAGKALLTTALASEWSTETSGAILLATPAGRHLYESVGFEAIDESITFYRGLEESVLQAIGQLR